MLPTSTTKAAIAFVCFSLIWFASSLVINDLPRASCDSSKRRGLLIFPLLSSCAQPVCAAQPTTTAEALRSAATKLPSSYYGPTDVFYPGHWKGSWKAQRMDVESGNVLDCNVRFITSIQDDAVVADRGFNAASLEGEANVKTDWSETNPNVLRINYPDGGWKELKVTQRATERNGNNVSSSEVYRITRQSAGISVPEISARRVLVKWKEMSPNEVGGLELVYNIKGEPRLLAKTRFFLQR